jgi:hypothetical protein
MKSNQRNKSASGKVRTLAVGIVASVAVLALGIGDASAGRGGARGGGGYSGGSGRMAQSSVSGANRGGNYGGNRAGTGAVNTGNVNRGNVNTGNINTGNVNRGNVNVGNDVNINIDNGYGHHGGYYRNPVAAGIVIGAVAVTRAAVLGAYYYSLPPSCTIVYRNSISYHYCGSVYYQQTWSGNDVVYVVVNP